jgi:hypothetical protein
LISCTTQSLFKDLLSELFKKLKSEEQSVRVRRILVQYVEAVIGMHAESDLLRPNLAFYRMSTEWLAWVCRELAVQDRLKLVRTMLGINVPLDATHLFVALETGWPLLRSALSDPSIPLALRQQLVGSGLAQLALVDKTLTMLAEPKIAELTKWRDDSESSHASK